MSTKRIARWFVGGILAGLMSLTAVVALRNSAEKQDASSRESGSIVDMGASYVPSFAELVADTSAIVIANYSSVSNLGSVMLAAPIPTPTGVYNFLPAPQPSANMIGTSVLVKGIIKNNGDISLNQTLIYENFGTVPSAPTALAINAGSHFPIVWPSNTQFMLFLDEVDDESGHYYIPYGRCGRVLTNEEETVSCSDAARTVLDFMADMSKTDFINAVTDEMNTPSPTKTNLPTDVLTATPTP